MKIEFDEKQLALLEQINAPHFLGKEYGEGDFVVLEEYIIDHATDCGQDDNGLSGVGEALIDIVAHIARASDIFYAQQQDGATA